MIKNKNIYKEYSPEKFDDNQPLDNDIKQSLSDEFYQMKQYAKSYRIPFEKEWRQIDAFTWNDIASISNPKLKKALSNSSMNHLFTIFNFRYSNVLTNNVAEGISVSSGFVDDKELNLKEISNKEEADQKLLIASYLLRVKQFRDILKFYWNDASVDEINKKVFRDYVLFGTGVIETWWNEGNKNKNNDGELELFYVPLFSFFLEPGVIEWQDSRYVIVAQEINLLNLQKVHNLSNERMKEITENIGSTNSNISQNIISNQNLSQYNKTVPYYRYYKKYIDEKNNIKISLHYFVGDSNPYLVQSVDDIGIDQFPFEVVFSYKRPTESYGQSIFKQLISAQKTIIQQGALVERMAIQAANPVLIVNTNTGINFEKLAKEGGVIPGQTYPIAGNPAETLAVVPLNKISEDALAYINVLKNYMDTMGNTTETTTGQRPITGAGSGAVQQNLQSAQMPFKIQESEIQTYYQRLLNLIVKLLLAKQTNVRQLISKDKTSSKVQERAISYNIEDFKNLAKTCKITIKATTALDIEKERQLLLEIYRLSLQYPELQSAVSAIDIIRAYNFSNEDEMIANIQLQQDTDYEQIATQIVGLVMKEAEMAIQAQQQVATIESYLNSGTVNQQDAEKAIENIPQPMPTEQLISIVLELIRNNPAKMLQNEQQLTSSEIENAGEING